VNPAVGTLMLILALAVPLLLVLCIEWSVRRAGRKRAAQWEADEQARRREAIANGRLYIPNPNPHRYWKT